MTSEAKSILFEALKPPPKIEFIVGYTPEFYTLSVVSLLDQLSMEFQKTRPGYVSPIKWRMMYPNPLEKISKLEILRRLRELHTRSLSEVDQIVHVEPENYLERHKKNLTSLDEIVNEGMRIAPKGKYTFVGIAMGAIAISALAIPIIFTVSNLFAALIAVSSFLSFPVISVLLSKDKPSKELIDKIELLKQEALAFGRVLYRKVEL